MANHKCVSNPCFLCADEISRLMKEKVPTIGDLAMLVARLVHQVRRFDPENQTAKDAMGYLKRKDLEGSVLREKFDEINNGAANSERKVNLRT